jgi:hypothetical protein
MAPVFGYRTGRLAERIDGKDRVDEGGTGVSLPKAARLSEIVNTDTRDQRVTGRGSQYTAILQHPITRHKGLLWNRNRAIHTLPSFTGRDP